MPPRDADALTHKVLGRIDDEALRRRMARVSRARALELRWERVAEWVMQVYQRALEEHRS